MTRDRIDDANRRFVWWRTKVMMRDVESPADAAAAAACKLCKGTGEAHICPMPHPPGRDDVLEQCLHPTVEEMSEFVAIRHEFGILAAEQLLRRVFDSRPELPLMPPPSVACSVCGAKHGKCDHLFSERLGYAKYGPGVVTGPRFANIVLDEGPAFNAAIEDEEKKKP